MLKVKKIKKTLSGLNQKVDFQEIDTQLLAGFECSQYNNHNKKFLSMIREQTNSAIDNRKYWDAGF